LFNSSNFGPALALNYFQCVNWLPRRKRDSRLPPKEIGIVAKPSTIAWQRAVILLSGTVVAATVVGCLYLARVICIPVALAVLLAFVLWPLVLASFAQTVSDGRAF
jgi:hypothetical protein